MGVLFRNAEAIEVLRQVNTLVVDKTGTLTEGKPTLVSITTEGAMDEKTLLRLVASLERSSEHPLAGAIVKGAEERGIELASTQGFESITGQGVKGRVDGRAVAVGNRALLEHIAGTAAEIDGRAEALRKDGQTVMFVAVDGKLAGFVGVARPSAHGQAMMSTATALMRPCAIRGSGPINDQTTNVATAITITMGTK